MRKQINTRHNYYYTNSCFIDSSTMNSTTENRKDEEDAAIVFIFLVGAHLGRQHVFRQRPRCWVRPFFLELVINWVNFTQVQISFSHSDDIDDNEFQQCRCISMQYRTRNGVFPLVQLQKNGQVHCLCSRSQDHMFRARGHMFPGYNLWEQAH